MDVHTAASHGDVARLQALFEEDAGQATRPRIYDG